MLGEQENTESSTSDSIKKRSMSDNNSDCKRLKLDMTFPYSKVVFIDSTWKKTKKIYMDERLKGFYYHNISINIIIIVIRLIQC